jgi:FkbM family methyltransferase
VKLKEVFYGLGLRPRAREYTYDLRRFAVDGVGAVDYAQWRHPSALRNPTTIDPAEVAGLRRHLRPGDVALDVGAHAGDSTLPIALAVGAEGLVLAFEPNPYVFRVLAANAGLNPRLTNVHPYMFAATAEDGPVTFEYSDPGYCNGGRLDTVGRWRHAHFFPLEVQGRNLARFVAETYPDRVDAIRFVKIDAEGHDHAVFRSLRPLVDRARPMIRSEMYRHLAEGARRAYVEELVAAGYDVRRMADDTDYEGEPLRVGDVMRWPHFDLLAVPR